jgi:serine/threonine protein kinase
VALKGVFQDGDTWGLELEMVDGMSLPEWQQNHPTQLLEPRLWVLAQIAQALAAAHTQGIIHRDLKPANILITENNIVKISDFGLGKVLSNNTINTECTTYTGTELYASPEQFNGESYSYSTDIYSLGIILFELVNLFTTTMERIIEIKNLKDGKQMTVPIILSMVNKEPELRPTAKILKQMFCEEHISTYIICRDIVWGIIANF